MLNLTAHHLQFNLQVTTDIQLNYYQGSAWRGMLFNALRGPQHNPALGFCTQRHHTHCGNCALVAVCPVAGLVSTFNPQSPRGHDVPRPYTIVPPMSSEPPPDSADSKILYQAGQALSFGLTLFGNVLDWFPYLVMALRQAEQQGIGYRLQREKGGKKRGTFKIVSAKAINLLSGCSHPVLSEDSPHVNRPDMPVTHNEVIQYATRLSEQWPQDEMVNLKLTFKTPTRIVSDGRLLKEPHFYPIFQRLLERLDALNKHFCHTDPIPQAKREALLANAQQVQLQQHQTYWQNLRSYSNRTKKATPIGGLLGKTTYQAKTTVWQRLLPYLIWGTIIHIGKNTVKGDGRITVDSEQWTVKNDK